MAPQAQRTTVVRPFRALHFDPARVTLQDVVAPPYDVVDEAQRQRLRRSSPHNVIRLVLPPPGQEAEAGELLEQWIADGVLVQEPEPCLYWLVQDAIGPDGRERQRQGLVA